jgi:hypothetical protein
MYTNLNEYTLNLFENIHTTALLLHTATLPDSYRLPHCRTWPRALPHTAARTATHCHTLHGAVHCSTLLPHIHCRTLPHTVIHYQAHCRTLLRALRAHYHAHCHNLPLALPHTAALPHCRPLLHCQTAARCIYIKSYKITCNPINSYKIKLNYYTYFDWSKFIRAPFIWKSDLKVKLNF